MDSESRQEIPGTIWMALRRASESLERAGVDSPRLTAEVLMAHVLGWERSCVLGHIQDPLTSGAYRKFLLLVQRRAAGEPLQYVTGKREFFGLSFRVTPAVLIPRPETELLVEKALELARSHGGAMRFADVGTGSGCIAISLAHEAPHAVGWATDVSQEALAVARENAIRLGVRERIGFVCGDLLECFPEGSIFDLILSNPPYVAGQDMLDLPIVVRDHEPFQALFGGESGLDPCRRIIPQAAMRLVPGGRLLLEIGAGQAPEVAELAERARLTVDEIAADLQGISRCIVARRRI
jgi:release factor glutamine methyltransferase